MCAFGLMIALSSTSAEIHEKQKYSYHPHDCIDHPGWYGSVSRIDHGHTISSKCNASFFNLKHNPYESTE